MFETYWGLKGKPFLNTPNPRFVFYSNSHEEALVRMLYTVTESKGLMLLLGEEGIGKTYTAQLFATEMKAKGYPVGFLKSPGRTPDDLLIQTLYEFGIPNPNVSSVEKLQILGEAAVGVGRTGRHLILIIDDAQLIQDGPTFEEIRAFLNITGEEHFLISVVLSGTPNLWQHLVAVSGMQQRVGVSYRILPLDREETEEYVVHRLDCVGRTEPVFEPGSFDLIYSATRGIPREINNLCDLCLLIGSGEEVDRVGVSLIDRALEEQAGTKVYGDGER